MPIMISCDQCGAGFSIPLSQRGKRRFCTPACREAWKWERQTICETCATRFLVSPSRVARGGGRGRFCSRACMGQARRVPLMDRFWTKVQKTDTCWLWTGMRNEHGYGRINRVDEAGARHDPYAHRLAWEEAAGRPLAEGEDVLHTCDTTACVRNDERGVYVVDGRTFERFGHLFAAAQADNNADRDGKDRVRHGERHANAKLTVADITRAEALYATGQISQRALARAFKVSHSTMQEALKGETWKRRS